MPAYVAFLCLCHKCEHSCAYGYVYAYAYVTSVNQPLGLIYVVGFLFMTVVYWGCGGVVVSMLDFRSESRWFEAKSLPLCCFLIQETLPHFLSLHPGG